MATAKVSYTRIFLTFFWSLAELLLTAFSTQSFLVFTLSSRVSLHRHNRQPGTLPEGGDLFGKLTHSNDQWAVVIRWSSVVHGECVVQMRNSVLIESGKRNDSDAIWRDGCH